MFSRCTSSHRAGGCLFWAVALWLWWCASASGQANQMGQAGQFKPYQLRALFLYNFAKFTKWPEAALGAEDKPFVVGIVGEDVFGESTSIIEGKPMKGHKVEVRRFPTVEQLGACHLLFISKSELPRLTEILAKVKDQPVLTVAEMDGFLEKGGMINLVISEKSTLTFDINLVAAERVGLKLDTRFLRLAREVKTE